MAQLLKQSSTAQPLLFLLVQSSDHITPLTGATPTVTISKAGGSFSSPSGAVTEIANGWYKVAGNGTDTNTLGPLILHASATSGDPADIIYEVVAYDPQDALRLGLTALPNANAGANGGLPTGNASGQVVMSGTASGALTSSSFASGAIDATAIAADAIGSSELASSAASEIATAVAAAVLATPANLLATDASGRVTAASVAGAVGSVTGNVGGNVVGSVGSVTAGVTVTTNNDKTGYTASTVSDKTGYALTAGEHTNIATDAQTGLTAQGYTSTRAGYLDTLNGLVAAIWDRLTSAITTVGSVGKLIKDNLDAAISSRLAGASYTAPDNADIATILTRTDVATSTRLATSGYTVPPTVGAIADAVWDEAEAAHDIVSTMGALVHDAGAAGDPLDQTVPGAYAAGKAGYALGQVAEMKSKVDLINPSAVTVQAAVGLNNNVTIRRGDAYVTGGVWGPLTWTETTGAWLAYVGKPAVFTAGTDISVEAVFEVVSGDTVRAVVELDSADTSALPLTLFSTGGGRMTRKYDIQVTLADLEDNTPVSGNLTILMDVTPPSV